VFDLETILQRFDRKSIAIPEIFSSSSARRYRDLFGQYYLSKNEKRDQTRVPPVGKWILYGEVKKSLIALFHGKCAFCEQATGLTVTHFRPSSEATPAENPQISHLYYSWLAGAWENLYVCCNECIEAKGRQFPIAGKRVPLPQSSKIREYITLDNGVWPDYPIREKTLLLDPCFDGRFYRHFQAQMSGALNAVSDEGKTTIDVFRLNRPELLTSRAQKMKEYARTLINSGRKNNIQTLTATSEIFNFKNLEFGGFWYLILRNLAENLPDVPSATGLQPNYLGRTLARQDGSVFKRLFSRKRKTALISENTEAHARTISTIEIKNFKAIENITLTLNQPQPSSSYQQPSLLILGENSAGKTSILEAIALALCKPAERVALALESKDLMLADELLGGTSEAMRSATVTISFTDEHVVAFKAHKDGLDGGALTQGVPVFAYGAFRQYLKQPGTDSAAKSIISLFKSDAILANPEKWLLNLESRTFDQVVRALREIFSLDGNFEVIKQEPQKDRCVIVNGPHLNSGKTPLSLASSGFRSMLGMLCEVMEGLLRAGVSSGKESFESIRAIVLIDEVEAHLHPRWKMQVMKGLRRALPEVTFIATTHDPLCLRGMEKDEAVVIRRVRKAKIDAGGIAEQVEVLTDLPDLTQLSVEQLLTSDFFGLVTTESDTLEQALDVYADLATSVQTGGLKAEDAGLQALKRDIADTLPIGNNAAQQLIQEALNDYLKKRRTESADTLKNLHETAKKSIIDALGGI
jgi:hypothetical protein